MNLRIEVEGRTSGSGSHVRHVASTGCFQGYAALDILFYSAK